MKKQILYVDDEELNLEIFEMLFEEHFEITLSDSPIKALDILKEKEFDGIISDMKMPEQNGLDFIKDVKKNNEAIPCFILTGFNDENEINEAVSQGILKGYFEKPLDVEEILEKINS